jgi:hypothetical protein
MPKRAGRRQLPPPSITWYIPGQQKNSFVTIIPCKLLCHNSRPAEPKQSFSSQLQLETRFLFIPDYQPAPKHLFSLLLSLIMLYLCYVIFFYRQCFRKPFHEPDGTILVLPISVEWSDQIAAIVIPFGGNATFAPRCERLILNDLQVVRNVIYMLESVPFRKQS